MEDVLRRGSRRLRLALASAALLAGAGAVIGQGGCALVVGADFDDKTLRECEACYDAPLQTEGRGACVGGCREGGACVGQVIPSIEDCATPEVDESCDGAAACTGEAISARQFGNPHEQEFSRMALDGDGHVILGVRARGEIDYGGGLRGAPQTPGLEEYNVHVAKLDPRGDHVWSKSFGDGSEQAIGGVATDRQGNVLVTGWLTGSMDFGGGPLNSDGPNFDVFVAKLDPDGEHLWSHRYGDAAAQFGSRVAVGPDGSVIVAGGMDGTADFGGGPLASAGGYDVFVLKLNAAGEHVWSKRFGDGATQYAIDVAVGPTGEIVMAGILHGGIDFGGGAIADEDGQRDGFVVKLDGSGDHLWTRHVKGAIATTLVAIDARGDVFVTGAFSGAMTVEDQTLQSAGQNDVLLLSYGSGGELRFASRFGDGSEQVGLTVAVDGASAVLVGGHGAGALDIGIDPVPVAGDTDAFVMKLDRAGEAYWGRYFGGGGTQVADTVATDRLGDVLVAGWNDGHIQLGDTGLPTQGARDIWLARLKP